MILPMFGSNLMSRRNRLYRGAALVKKWASAVFFVETFQVHLSTPKHNNQHGKKICRQNDAPFLVCLALCWPMGAAKWLQGRFWSIQHTNARALADDCEASENRSGFSVIRVNADEDGHLTSVRCRVYVGWLRLPKRYQTSSHV